MSPSKTSAPSPSDCLRHRLVLSFEANADGVTTDDVIETLLKNVAIA